MNNKIHLFILLLIFSGSTFAEYNLVYSPQPCRNCEASTGVQHAHQHQVNRHKSSRVKPTAKNYVSRHQLSAQSNACGQCETCSCNGAHAISASRPTYDGEYCTTYEDVIQGDPNTPTY